MKITITAYLYSCIDKYSNSNTPEYRVYDFQVRDSAENKFIKELPLSIEVPNTTPNEVADHFISALGEEKIAFIAESQKTIAKFDEAIQSLLALPAPEAK